MCIIFLPMEVMISAIGFCNKLLNYDTIIGEKWKGHIIFNVEDAERAVCNYHTICLAHYDICLQANIVTIKYITNLNAIGW